MLNLVTGATGFVGSHLVEALVLRGEKVRALVRPTSHTQVLRRLGVELRIGNLSDNATLIAAMQGVDRVFHCAALVSDWGPEEDFRLANVSGVRSVLAAATSARVGRLIHLSTSDVYGFPGRPAFETEHPSPRGFPYADSKIEGEALVWNHYQNVGLPICILRPATVYGPRSSLTVMALIEALRNRRTVLIDHGRHVAGLTYVGNLVDAMILAADQEASIGQTYNVSDDSPITWRQYIDALAELAEVPRPTRSLSHTPAALLASFWESYYRMTGRTERPPWTHWMVELLGTDQIFPSDKIKRELGYRPRVSFEQGIRYTGDWLHQNHLLEWDN